MKRPAAKTKKQKDDDEDDQADSNHEPLGGNLGDDDDDDQQPASEDDTEVPKAMKSATTRGKRPAAAKKWMKMAKAMASHRPLQLVYAVSDTEIEEEPVEDTIAFVEQMALETEADLAKCEAHGVDDVEAAAGHAARMRGRLYDIEEICKTPPRDELVEDVLQAAADEATLNDPITSENLAESFERGFRVLERQERGLRPHQVAHADAEKALEMKKKDVKFMDPKPKSAATKSHTGDPGLGNHGKAKGSKGKGKAKSSKSKGGKSKGKGGKAKGKGDKATGKVEKNTKGKGNRKGKYAHNKGKGKGSSEVPGHEGVSELVASKQPQRTFVGCAQGQGIREGYSRSGPSPAIWAPQETLREKDGFQVESQGKYMVKGGVKFGPQGTEIGLFRRQLSNFEALFFEENVGHIAEDEVRLLAEGLLQKVNYYHFLYPIAQLFLWCGMLSSVLVCCVLLGLYYKANYPETPWMWRSYSGILGSCALGCIFFFFWIKFRLRTKQIQDGSNEIVAKTISGIYREALGKASGGDLSRSLADFVEFRDLVLRFLPQLRSSQMERLWKFLQQTCMEDPSQIRPAGSDRLSSETVMSAIFGPTLTSSPNETTSLGLTGASGPGSAPNYGAGGVGREVLEQLVQQLVRRVGEASPEMCFDALNPFVTAEHFKQLLTSRLGLHYDPVKAKQIFKLIDSDRDGKITRIENRAEMVKELPRCAACGLEAVFLCSGCRRVRFCSFSCQRQMWKEHRRECQGTSRVRRTEGAAPDGSWVMVFNTDALPGHDAGAVSTGGPAKAKAVCEEKGFGGMVLWQNTFFLRKEPAEELVAAMQHAQGTHLWLPLPAARALPKRPLPERLEEVMVEGAKGVKKLGEREGSTGRQIFCTRPLFRIPLWPRKCRSLTVEEMDQHFRDSTPVVLTDAQEGWPAREKWTFEWMAATYGHETMPCSDLAPFFRHVDRGQIRTVQAPMAEFVRYVRGEASVFHALQLEEWDRIFYANGWAPFLERPELLEDVCDRLYCVRDAVPKNSAGDGARIFDAALTKIFMGPAGTVSRLHHDTYATHVWLSQIRGRKQNLHSLPVDEVDGRTSLFDPEHPDFGRFPNARKAQAGGVMGVMGPQQSKEKSGTSGLFHGIGDGKMWIFVPKPDFSTILAVHNALPIDREAYSVVVEEGETVVLPARWWHWAKSLTPSITLMRRDGTV
eukprot:s8_g27.t1